MCPPLSEAPSFLSLRRPTLRRPILRHLARSRLALRRFRREEDGTVLTEFLILLPLLIWATMAIFVYWDTFRTLNEAQKASYAVADMISRQRADITTGLVNGLDEAMEMMMTDAGAINVRLTSVQYSTAGLYVVLFSRSSDGVLAGLNAAAITARASEIPIMAPLDSVVILETEVTFTPLFDLGILGSAFGPAVEGRTFRNFVVTRPRSLLRICLSGITCPTVV